MNDLVREYLAARGCNETLKNCPGQKDADRTLKQFKKFKKINLDENNDSMARSVIEVNTKSKKAKREAKKKEIEPKREIPNDFIAHIVKLGFDKKDAGRLYESKDDWLGMSVGGKILCVERGCKFEVPLSSDALFEHCRTVHGWRDYPCTHDNCRYVAYSPTNLKKHMSSSHSPYRTHNGNYYSCTRPGCKAAFAKNAFLLRHEKIHDNDLFRCIFCPYGNADPDTFGRHQRMHFNTRDCVCHVCNKTFTTTTHLNPHILKVHNRDQIKTQCPLCDKIAVKHKI